MRIVILTTSYPAGEDDPSGHFVQAEARAYVALGHSVTVISPKSSRAAQHAHDGVTVVALPAGSAFGWPGAASNLRAGPWRIWGVARWVIAARRVLRARGPFDRVIAHWVIPCGWPIASRADASVPVELVSHGADVRFLRALPRPLRSRIVGRLVRRAARWRWVSTPLLDSLLNSLSHRDATAVRTKAYVEPSPIEMPDVLAEVRRLKQRYAGTDLSVAVGRLVPSKRFDQAIAYAAGRAAAHPSVPALLVIVGEGPERAQLERLARTLRVAVLFTGLQSRRATLAWIGAADRVVTSSAHEGCSTVVREAVALGTPVIEASTSRSPAHCAPSILRKPC